VKVSASPGLSREPYPFRDVAVHIKRAFDAYGHRRRSGLHWENLSTGTAW
jgi:hypothetical protein